MNTELLETRTFAEKESTGHLLKKLLADTYSLMLKTQNYHWNVKGPNFFSFHKMFEEQYKELFNAIDLIAERIRAVGGVPLLTLQEISNLSNVTEPKMCLSSQEMVEDLKVGHMQLLKDIAKSLPSLREYFDETTTDLLTDRALMHEKYVWYLSSSSLPLM